eukprot:6152078-Prymnesium_polylepis.1
MRACPLSSPSRDLGAPVMRRCPSARRPPRPCAPCGRPGSSRAAQRPPRAYRACTAARRAGE